MADRRVNGDEIPDLDRVAPLASFEAQMVMHHVRAMVERWCAAHPGRVPVVRREITEDFRFIVKVEAA